MKPPFIIIAGFILAQILPTTGPYNPATILCDSIKRDGGLPVYVQGSTSGTPDKLAITFTIDAGTGTVAAGSKGWTRIPYAGTITAWELTASPSGSIVIDVWKSTYENFPPVDGGSIAGTELPTLSGVQKNQDTNLTTWTVAVAEGDYIRINIDSASGVKYVLLSISITRS